MTILTSITFVVPALAVLRVQINVQNGIAGLTEVAWALQKKLYLVKAELEEEKHLRHLWGIEAESRISSLEDHVLPNGEDES